MKKIYFFGVIFIFGAIALNSCKSDANNSDNKSAKPSLETLKESVKEMKDSLKTLQAKGQKIESLHRIELINRLLSVYHNYPKSEPAADCLFETHMIYSAMEAHDYSVAYGDTLLNEYPKYKNRALVLESQGANYDIFIAPRDSSKVRFYYSALLNENPKMDKEKREGILERLNYNNLNYDEFIEKKY